MKIPSHVQHKYETLCHNISYKTCMTTKRRQETLEKLVTVIHTTDSNITQQIRDGHTDGSRLTILLAEISIGQLLIENYKSKQLPAVPFHSSTF